MKKLFLLFIFPFMVHGSISHQDANDQLMRTMHDLRTVNDSNAQANILRNFFSHLTLAELISIRTITDTIISNQQQYPTYASDNSTYIQSSSSKTKYSG